MHIGTTTRGYTVEQMIRATCDVRVSRSHRLRLLCGTSAHAFFHSCNRTAKGSFGRSSRAFAALAVVAVRFFLDAALPWPTAEESISCGSRLKPETPFASKLRTGHASPSNSLAYDLCHNCTIAHKVFTIWITVTWSNRTLPTRIWVHTLIVMFVGIRTR